MRLMLMLMLVPVLAVVISMMPLAAVAQEEGAGEIVRSSVVEIVPEEGAAVTFDGRRYSGSLRISGHSSGLAVVESVALDDYLAGIQEVPFSWEPAALEAQAIAARTYLAWNLARGRTEAGRRYGYDICATDACQVYAGLEPRLSTGGDRWLAAVTATRSEILLHDGYPAQAYYSSTTGGRTRSVGDVWPDIDLPYLRAVDSPGEESPFVEWSWSLPGPQMDRLVRQAGLVRGELVDVVTTTTADGEGPWTVTVVSTGGEETLTTWEMRGRINRAAEAAVPHFLPGVRPDGKRYPQSVLSPTYTISSVHLPLGGVGAPPSIVIYQAQGRGWGHLVGMSQYGAQAMARRGAGAEEILAHYYNGLVPEDAPQWVPDTVEVVLATAAPSAEVGVTGPVSVTLDGREVGAEELGSWQLASDRGSVVVTAPVGLGFPPTLRPGLIGFERGRLVLRPEVTAAAEVEWEVRVEGKLTASHGPEAVDAGFLAIPIPLEGGSKEISVRATNTHGGDQVSVAFGVDDERE